MPAANRREDSGAAEENRRVVLVQAVGEADTRLERAEESVALAAVRCVLVKVSCKPEPSVLL